MKKLFAILLAFAFSVNAYASPRKPNFRHLGLEDGLSSITVSDIWTDPSGVIWIATVVGLDRYDGNSISRMEVPYEIHQGIPDMITKQLAGTNDGYLYVLYGNCIGLLNTYTEEIKLYLPEICNYITYSDGLWIAQKNNLLFSDNPDSMPKNICTIPSAYGEITAISHSANGDVWIGSESGKLLKLTGGGKLEVVSESLTSKIQRIYIDSNETVWVGYLLDGVFSISEDGIQTRYVQASNGTYGISSNFVRDFCEDNLGNIWIGTYSGLDCLNPATGEITRYYPELTRHDSISHSSIWAIRKDSQGTMWVATYYGGVNYFNPEYDIYTRYPVSDIEGKGLSSPIISKVVEDDYGNLWVATEGGGLNKLNIKTGEITWYNTASPANRRLTENNVEDMIYVSSDHAIWMGLHLGGVNFLDLRTGKIRSYQSNSSNPESLPSNDVLSVADYGDSLIVRMRSHASVMDKRTGKCRPIRPICEYLEEGGNIRIFLCDRDKNLWICKQNPSRLAKLSPPYTEEIEYTANNTKEAYFPNEISGMMQDNLGNIWLASTYDGLFVYNCDNDCFASLGGEEIKLRGLHHMAESPISGNIICSSEDGFFIFNRLTREISRYSKENGFPLGTPYTQCITVLNNSEIFIGGYDGLVSVSEEDLNISKKPYNLFFSRLTINGETVESGSKILPVSIFHTRSLTLPHSTKSIEVQFSSSNHIDANNGLVEYCLEGFDTKWTKVIGERKISYTNLRPGKYKLHLRSTSVSSDCCPDTSLDILILPPWWATWYAICFYILFVVCLALLFMNFYKSRVQMREYLKHEQERAVDLENLNQAKLRFFTNISHEIRTPLTIIIAEIESMIQHHNFSPAMYRRMLGIYKNSLSLRELISELMEFRKQEQGELKIRVAPHDIMFFINEFFLLISEYASSKEIKLTLVKEIESLEVWYDQVQMQKVLNNLLSNSIKFTPKGGEITITVYSTEGSVIIEIKDTGCGIPKKDLKNIFDRFYQVEYSSQINTGTGIGLALAQGIVKMHSGIIEVESDEGVGSVFRIILPLGYSHFPKEQIDQERKINTALSVSDKVSIPSDTTYFVDDADDTRKYTVVVAEDNNAILNLLIELFSPYYKVVPTTDGVSALNEVRKHLPSLVVSDVLMPGMSGTKLCRTIKNDPTLCHIPVVLLTARVEVEQNMEGLQQGADDYITKPFNSTLLLSRCNNLVNSRLILQEKYDKSGPSTWMLATNRIDNDFMAKVTSLVGQNIDNVDFDISSLVQDIGMSRTGFFRKLKAITGQTPTQFILTVRLKRAAELLLNNPDMNIVEISDSVGFSSSQYFAKCFKKYMGKSPLSYRKENTIIDK